MFPLLNFPAILAVLPPCGSAIGTSKELGRGLVAAPRLDQPVERLMIVALRAFSLRLRKGPTLLFFPSYDNALLPLMGNLLTCLSPRVLVKPHFPQAMNTFFSLLAGRRVDPHFGQNCKTGSRHSSLGGEFICWLGNERFSRKIA